MPPSVHVEKVAVDYIIEHIDEFKDEFSKMGYEAKAAYTGADIWKEEYEEDEYFNKQTKLGYQDRGILILSNDKEEYRFDVGFDYYETYIDDGNTFVSISNDRENDVLDLNEESDEYPVYVTISNQEIDDYWIGPLYNVYNIEFTTARRAGLHGAQLQADKWIKEYISAEELREIYERCIGLQEKLVELYKMKRE